MESKVHAAVARVEALIDEESHPQAMSLEEAKEFYEELQGSLEAKLDGIQSDLANQG